MTMHHPALSDHALVGGSEGALLYSEGPGRDTLIIGFCGRAELLLLPTATILQYLSTGADLLVLRDYSKKAFTNGIAEYAGGFAATLEALRGPFDFARYRNIRCLGTSGGGAAALGGGIVLNADRAACFGGLLPSKSPWFDPTSPEIEDLITGSPGSQERFYAVFGEQCDRDRRDADEIASVFAVTLYAVPGIDEHNLIRRLHVDGQLARVFAEVGLT